MFGRRAGRQPTTVQGVVGIVGVPVAEPDYASRARERALRYMTGRQLQGESGLVVDYDRGDPAHSFERVIDVPAHAQPVGAYARLGMRDSTYLPPSEIYDTGSTDAELTAYQAAMLARIARP